MRTALGRYVRPTYGASWTPADISGLVAAWDFSDTSTITESSGNVSQVDGAYGTSISITQGTSANQPITGTRTLGTNALNCLDFTPDDYLSWTGTELTGSAWTVFVVALADSMRGAFNLGLVVLRSTGANDYNSDASLIAAHELNSKFTFYQNARTATPASTVSAATPYLMAHVIGTSAQSTRLNGAETATATNTMTSLSAENIHIGARYWSGIFREHWDGTIGEILLYSDELSGTDVATVEGFLNTKWGIY